MDLKTLTDLNGVSGNEKTVRKAIFEAALPLCDRVEYDGMGNVVAYKKGKDRAAHPGIIIAAHMDEVGFIITSATADGLLRFTCVGGIDPRVIVSKRVLVGDSRIPGVIGATAIHLQTPEDRKRVLKYAGLYIDIGAKTKEEAAEACPQGSYAVFDTPYIVFGDGFVSAKALDDRIGCLTMLESMKTSYAPDITYLFTAEEEVGLRGALGGAYASDAEIAVVLEGTTCNDLGDVPDTQKVCRAGSGVAISFMDRSSIVYWPLYKRMIDLAEEKAIPYQIKNASTGGNDAGALQRKAKSRKTVVLSVPCRYIHGPSSCVKYADILTQQALLDAFLNDPKV